MHWQSFYKDEERDLVEDMLAPGELYDAYKGLHETGALVGTLVFAFIYDGSNEMMNLCDGGKYYADGDGCELPSDTLWAENLHIGVRVREYVLASAGILSAITVAYSIFMLIVLARMPQDSIKFWFKYAPQRLSMIYQFTLATVGCVLYLLIINITVTRPYDIGLFIVIAAIIMTIVCYLYFHANLYMMMFCLRKMGKERESQKGPRGCD